MSIKSSFQALRRHHSNYILNNTSISISPQIKPSTETVLWLLSSAYVVYFNLHLSLSLHTISYMEFWLLLNLVKSSGSDLTWAGNLLSFSRSALIFEVRFDGELHTVNYAVDTYIAGLSSNLYFKKNSHYCIGTKSDSRVDSKRDTMITPQIFISIHWSNKIKPLKNSMNQLAYKIQTIWIILYLIPVLLLIPMCDGIT